MKKSVLLILSSTLLFGVCSCANNESNNDTQQEDKSNNEGRIDDTPAGDKTEEPNEDQGSHGENDNNPIDQDGKTDGTEGESDEDDPNHDEESGQNEQATELDITIINENSDKFSVISDKDKAKPGSIITLTINSKLLGYEIKSITFLDSENSALESSKSNNKYEVALPKDGIIHVSGTLIGITLKAYIFDENNNFNGDIYISNDEGGFTKLSEHYFEEGVMYFNVQYGRILKLKLDINGFFEPTGVMFNGEEHALDSNNEVRLLLEKETLASAFFSITVLSVDNTPTADEGNLNLEVQSSEHIKGTLYKDDLKTVVKKANEQDIIYLAPNITDEDYSVKSVKLKYRTTEFGSESTRVVSLDDETGLYKFSVPYAYDGSTITVVIEELSNSTLKDNELAGEYFTFILSSASKHNFKIDESKPLSIEQSGKITYNQKETYVTNVYQNSIYTDSFSTLYYGNNLFLADSDLRAPFTSYDLMGIKKANESDLADDYSIKGERFEIDSKYYFVIEISYKNKLYATAFIKWTDNDVVFGIEIEYLYGSSFVDDKVMYNLKNNDENIFSVSWSGDGGYTDRILMSPPLGMYTNNESKLYIPNSLVAIYDNLEFPYTMAENTLTLKNSTRKITLTLNYETNTFNVVSDETLEASELPNFKGKMFSGSFYDDWWESDTRIDIEFNNYENDNISGIIYHGGKGVWACHDFGFSATYNLDQNILTITITSERYNEGFVAQNKQIRLKATNGALIGLDDLNNVYPMKNISFYCEDFTL